MAMASLRLAPPSSSSLLAASSFHGRRLVAVEFGAAWKYRSLGVPLSSNGSSVVCSLLTSTKDSSPDNLEKEAHKYFDQVTITVRSGDGGNGAVLTMPKPPENRADAKKQKRMRAGSFRRGPDGSMLLPVGGKGGDVTIEADPNADSLLPFHKLKKYSAKRGSNVDALNNVLSPVLRDAAAAPTLKICVPVGTVVKERGQLLADLSKPGDKILVASGGYGGSSMLDGKRLPHGLHVPTIKDLKDKELLKGFKGEQKTLELTLRVVADVGLVGLPNAGKSSLLAAVSQAKPEIAPYPFTTLMPNLGRIEDVDGSFGGKGATFADLPGLIKDAHLGKGLGLMFLRHLKRTRLIIHVVDASAVDAFEGYRVLCDELRLYNPAYLDRPHIVVLNKLDVPEARERAEALKRDIRASSGQVIDTEGVKGTLPSVAAVVGISALKRKGVNKVLNLVRTTLKRLDEEESRLRDDGHDETAGSRLYYLDELEEDSRQFQIAQRKQPAAAVQA